MAQTYARLLFHVVFSTKHRAPLVADSWSHELYAYIGGIVRKRRGDLLAAGGIEDHVHLLIRGPASISVSDLVRDIKTNSSAWRHELGDDAFGWQSGYGAFTVSPSLVDKVAAYIGNQKEHHRTQSFHDEFRSLLQKHGFDLDERYMWD